MPITPEAQQRAQEQQTAAALDEAATVRVVAGPGTGKSRAIGERVLGLLDRDVAPDAIHVVSFTRAAVQDLVFDIGDYLSKRGVDARVQTTTLHSLALRLLRKGNLLNQYPVEPKVIDDWETRRIIDEEFDEQHGCGLVRADYVRRHHEALGNTGEPPPEYDRPQEAVTDQELREFASFLQQRRSLYSCVLPGELVRQCVDNMQAGSLDPDRLLELDHLIVDEYQDLNPVDVEFVDLLARADVFTYVCGDDDQSLYSFRFASPAGIQGFPERHPGTSSHTLEDCFRCAPTVLDAAQQLVQQYAGPGRLPKNHKSLWADADPPVQGQVGRWKFDSDAAEASALAESCAGLSAAGVPLDKVFVLMSNQRVQATILYKAFEDAGVPHVRAKEATFIDGDAGRAVLSVLRIGCDPDDLVAHRVLFGLLPGIGRGSCLSLVNGALAKNVAAQTLFAGEYPKGTFNGRVVRALGRMAEQLHVIKSWSEDDLLETRRDDVAGVLAELEIEGAPAAWLAITEPLAGGTKLAEVRAYVWASNVDQATRILQLAYARLDLELPEAATVPNAVRFMSIHGSKGLSAHVVFVPGIEDELLPGPKRKPVPGLVQEAARLLYVAITRARGTCVLTFATNRTSRGQWGATTPSEFLPRLGGKFDRRTGGLDPGRAQVVADTIQAMQE